MTTKTFLTTSLLTTGLLVLSQASAFASTNAKSTGNGYGSDNKTNVVMNDSTHVSQTNTAHVTNNVSINGNTGDNMSTGNNGNTAIHTGDVNTMVTISTTANQNTATINGCNCASDAQALTTSNGSGSQNGNSFESNKTTTVAQSNLADVNNIVAVNANTGGSQSSNNTGNNSGSMENGWGMYSHNFWKMYWMESKSNNNWKNPHFWNDFCDQWMKDHGNNGDNGGSMNGGNTKITTGDVNADVTIHNNTNSNELSM